MERKKSPGSPDFDDSALPADAPPGHEAHLRVRVSNPHSCTVDGTPLNQFITFTVKVGAEKIRVQTTVNGAGGSTHGALQIARAMWVKLEEGMSKEAVLKFRAECYEKLLANIAQRKQQNGANGEAGKGEKAKEEKKKSEEVKKSKSKEEKKEAKKEEKKEKKEAKKEEKKEKKEAKEAKKEDKKEDRKDDQKEDKKEEKNGVKKDQKQDKNESHEPEKKDKEKKEVRQENGGVKEELVEKKEELKEAAKVEKKEETKEELNDAKEELVDEEEVVHGVVTVGEKQTSADQSGAVPKGTRGKVPNIAPEALQSYDPGSSGLSAAALAALPADATEQEVFDAVWRQRISQGLVYFDLDGTRLQVTNNAVGGSWYATFRIARACYVKIRDGMSKDDTLAFRNQCYTDFKAAAGDIVAPKIPKPPRGVKRKNTEQKERPSKEKTEKKDKKSKKKKKKKKVTESSISSETSSSSSSESESDEESDSPYLWPKQTACAKMLVRAGHRCLCHFQVNCPTKLMDAARRNVAVAPNHASMALD